MIVPLIVIAECFSWHAVLTTKYLHNAIENSIWAVVFFIIGIGLCRLLPEFDGAVRMVLIVSIAGIAFYLAFLMTVDVPMYLNRWRADVADGNTLLKPLEGLRDVSTRWIVTHDLAEWKEEIAWMSLYFSLAVWSSLALCVFYSLGDQLPRYRTQATTTSRPATQIMFSAQEWILTDRGRPRRAFHRSDFSGVACFLERPVAKCRDLFPVGRGRRGYDEKSVRSLNRELAKRPDKSARRQVIADECRARQGYALAGGGGLKRQIGIGEAQAALRIDTPGADGDEPACPIKLIGNRGREFVVQQDVSCEI